MRYLIGVDDTDNEFTRGTGFRTRHLTSLIHQNKMGNIHSISRHQLLVHPEIPYTSHNSSACLDIETDDIERLKSFCIEYLTTESAEGSDVGLCIAQYNKISETIINWGLRAKKEVLTQNEAKKIAASYQIYLEGFLGTKGGIIGALAAIGLRTTGNDGRLFWIKGKDLREYNGIYTANQLLEPGCFDKILSINSEEIKMPDRIFVNEWLRPVLKNNNICVIVEPNVNRKDYEWNITSKEYIKSISD